MNVLILNSHTQYSFFQISTPFVFLVLEKKAFWRKVQNLFLSLETRNPPRLYFQRSSKLKIGSRDHFSYSTSTRTSKTRSRFKNLPFFIFLCVSNYNSAQICLQHNSMLWSLFVVRHWIFVSSCLVRTISIIERGQNLSRNTIKRKCLSCVWLLHLWTTSNMFVRSY